MPSSRRARASSSAPAAGNGAPVVAANQPSAINPIVPVPISSSGSGNVVIENHSRRPSAIITNNAIGSSIGGTASQPVSRRGSTTGPMFYVDDEVNTGLGALTAADSSMIATAAASSSSSHHRRRSTTGGHHSRQGSITSGNGTGHRRQSSRVLTDAERQRQAALAQIFVVKKDENFVEAGGEPMKKPLAPSHDNQAVAATAADDASDPDITPTTLSDQEEVDDEDGDDDHSIDDDAFPPTSSLTTTDSKEQLRTSDTVPLAADSGDDSDYETRQLPEWMRRRTSESSRIDGTSGTGTGTGTGGDPATSPMSPATPGFSPLVQLTPMSAPSRSQRGQRFSLAQIDYDTIDVAALTRSVSGRNAASPREMAAAVQGRGGSAAGRAFAAASPSSSSSATSAAPSSSSAASSSSTTIASSLSTSSNPMSPTSGGSGSGSFTSPVRLHRSPTARSPLARTPGTDKAFAFPSGGSSHDDHEHKDSALVTSSVPATTTPPTDPYGHIINRAQIPLDEREKKRLIALRIAESFNPLTLERMPSRLSSPPRSPLGQPTGGGWSSPSPSARGSMSGGRFTSSSHHGATIPHQHMFMFLDETVDEGQEFCMYAYPNQLTVETLVDGGPSTASRMLNIRSALAALEGTVAAVTGQKSSVATFDEHVKVGVAGTPLRVKAIVMRLDGISTGMSMAVLSLDPNVTDASLIHIANTVLSLARFVIGPIHLGLFKGDKPTPKSASGDIKVSGDTEMDPSNYSSYTAMQCFDPLLRLCASTLLRADAESLFVETLGHCVTWFLPSLDLSHEISEQLSALETTSRLLSPIKSIPLSSSSSHPSSSSSSVGSDCLFIGTTIYHRGAVLASHLSPADLKVSTSFCKLHSLFTREYGSEMHISFHDVFGHLGERRILVFIAYADTALVMILEQIGDISTPIGVDPYLVNEGKDCLLRIIRGSSHLIHRVDHEMFAARALCATPPAPVPPSLMSPSAAALSSSGKKNKDKSDILDSLPPGGQITAGPANVLFHYLAMDLVQGMIIGSHTVGGTSVLRSEFIRTAMTIRHTLMLAKDLYDPSNSQSIHCDQMAASDEKLGAGNHAFFRRHPVIEAARHLTEVGFRLQSATNLGFWVVGRLYPPAKECYVCYHEVIPQSMVDVAFRLVFAMV